MNEMTRNQEIATIIRSQIKTIVFMQVGASDFFAIESGLQFRTRVKTNQKHWIEITLNGLDYYDIVLKRLVTSGKRKGEVVAEYKANNVDCSTLSETVYRIGSTNRPAPGFLEEYGIKAVQG